MTTKSRVQVGLYPGEHRPFLKFDFIKGGSAELQQNDRSRLLATEGLNPFVSGTARHFAEFIGALRDGSEPRCTAKHHRKTLALVLAAYDSAAARRSIELGPYFCAPAE